ncbi:MAG: VWA domain-containing protein [Bacteroidetes bacterium]|nr:MAG: VWA domain-containing protein [Bacteroidota bacterium]
MKRVAGSFVLLIFAVTAALAQTRQATLLDHKDRIRLTRLDALNSTYRETNLSITPDGKYLFFMSLRGGQKWSNAYMVFRGDSVYDGDIWYSQKSEGKWMRAKCLPEGINSSSGEDEPNVTPDGRAVYFQSWNAMWMFTGGPYYKARRSGDTWTQPQGLGGGITEFFRPGNMPATDGMTLSPDEKRFVVAAGPDYDDNMDLFMSKYTSNGWSYCQKLPISTPGDERSCFIAADGRTLYFASDGYQGFGGLDIFKTTLNADGTFGEVINIGAPFNTSADDYGFILTANGMEGYFVRNGDIYFADLSEADTRIRPAVVSVNHTLTISVKDSSNWKALSAEVLVMDALTKRIIQKSVTPATGKLSLTLPNEVRTYDIVTTLQGYTAARRRISSEKLAASKTYSVNFLLSKPKTAPSEPLAVTTQPTAPPIKTIEPPKPPVTRAEEPKQTPPQTPAPVPVKPKPVDPYDFQGIAKNNLTLLLDVSASMNKPEKLPLLKQSLEKLLGHMRPEDRISVIVYSGDAKVVLDGVSAVKKELIISSIERLSSSGASDGKEALRKAYQLAETHYIAGGNNRIILATDGYFDLAPLFNIAEKNGDKGIALTVFSFGKLPTAKNDELQKLATAGKGNYANVRADNADAVLLKEAKAVRAK